MDVRGGTALHHGATPGWRGSTPWCATGAAPRRAEGAGSVSVPLGQSGARGRVRSGTTMTAARSTRATRRRAGSRRSSGTTCACAFDPDVPRPSDPAWVGGLDAPNRYSDGFPLLVVSLASLADLNARLDEPVPMERFRPNLVFDGLPRGARTTSANSPAAGAAPRGEALHALRRHHHRPAQRRAAARRRAGAHAARIRWNAALRGVMFGQNAVVVAGRRRDARGRPVVRARRAGARRSGRNRRSAINVPFATACSSCSGSRQGSAIAAASLSACRAAPASRSA